MRPFPLRCPTPLARSASPYPAFCLCQICTQSFVVFSFSKYSLVPSSVKLPHNTIISPLASSSPQYSTYIHQTLFCLKTRRKSFKSLYPQLLTFLPHEQQLCCRHIPFSFYSRFLFVHFLCLPSHFIARSLVSVPDQRLPSASMSIPTAVRRRGNMNT
jgi:hypothetical protein